MIEIWADVELKDTILVAMPKLVREGFYTCTIRVKYEWKPPRCACCKVFGHVQDECPKNVDSDVAKNLKKPSQAPRGVLVGPKVGFQPIKQVYRPVSKKNNANTSGNKKKDTESEKRKTYENVDYDYNPYDDDMYEGHEIPDNIQSICDNLDIKVRGRKKK
ncbi:putative RNA-directed DNA polymerase [Tanacetum coccineum]